MNLMTDNEFDEFFGAYAGNVEGFYEVAYWRLSDELIKSLIRKHLEVTRGDVILDAGGGTGRWARWASAELGVAVTVADRSARMLSEARSNVTLAGQHADIDLVHCDLQDPAALAGRQFDGVISTYGVLSFLEDPQAFFDTVFRMLKPGACAMLMSHSLSNALVSKVNRDGARPAELRELLDRKVVKWAPHVPALRVFSAEDLRGLANRAGLVPENVFGVTSIAIPGPEDFGYPYEEVSAISKALEDDEYFQMILELEITASERQEWAERGVNLMIKVRKPA